MSSRGCSVVVYGCCCSACWRCALQSVQLHASGSEYAEHCPRTFGGSISVEDDKGSPVTNSWWSDMVIIGI